MSKIEKKKSIPGKAKNEKQPQPAKDKQDDSDAIERAVYDGMQDLRVKKPR